MSPTDLAVKDGEPSPQVAFRPETKNASRPAVRGKFLFVNGRKFYVKGVTYGTFSPGPDGTQFPTYERALRDFEQMKSAEINTIRLYTVPPRWLLDAAAEHGLMVLAGIPWEQHVTFLDDNCRAADIVDRVRLSVSDCAGHPAILGYAIGNEIPGSIVRWHGRRRVERFLRRLYDAAKIADPEGLVTYVNFPTTEYLELPFLDFIAFNVYLEDEAKLDAYLYRLQNIAGDKPLVLAEIGLDSRRNSERVQADVLQWQIRACFRGGAAGVFLFAWTDEWHRGGFDIDDWDFGLTTRDRRPKLALDSVRRAYRDSPFPLTAEWPLISVVVCSFNGARTLAETLSELDRLDYPHYEVIVVNDGSTDSTPDIAAQFDVRLISTENGGLSHARNVGWTAARGEIVAYIDDDAYPDPHWLHYLATEYIRHPEYGSVGGPNLTPAGDGLIAEAVSLSPGNPIHVLLTDSEAEHVPGVNSSFRRSALAAIGGYDPQYRTAGDDVDVGWRILEQGWKIGYSPAAVVWHHRRNSVKAYWRQQIGYGRAEALLERKWPEKYNSLGHLSWAGRVYVPNPLTALELRPSRVYHGVWGEALFQSLYQPGPMLIQALPQMPEWHLVCAGLFLISTIGLLWTPFLAFWPVLILFAGLPLLQAVAASWQAANRYERSRPGRRFILFLLVCLLHIAQPIARLRGRVKHGLTPWRHKGQPAWQFPRNVIRSIWSERWRMQQDWTADLESALKDQKVFVTRGSDYDGWDLKPHCGLFGSARVSTTVEEHGGGRQFVRFRVAPVVHPLAAALALLFGSLSMYATIRGQTAAAAAAAALGALVVMHVVRDLGAVIACVTQSISRFEDRG